MADPMEELEALRRGEFDLPVVRSTPAPAVRPEPGVREPLDEEAADHLVSMTFRSRTDNQQPHVVSVGYDGVVYCTCRATHACWAVKAFTALTGRPTP